MDRLWLAKGNSFANPQAILQVVHPTVLVEDYLTSLLTSCHVFTTRLILESLISAASNSVVVIRVARSYPCSIAREESSEGKEKWGGYPDLLGASDWLDARS